MRKATDGGFDRKQLALIGTPGFVECVRTDSRPSKTAKVGAAAEEMSEVGSQRPNVGAGGAGHLDTEHTRRCGLVDDERRDGDRTRLPLDLDALTGQFVQTSAIDSDGRDHRRDLFDGAGQVLCHDPACVVECHGGSCRAPP